MSAFPSVPTSQSPGAAAFSNHPQRNDKPLKETGIEIPVVAKGPQK